METEDLRAVVAVERRESVSDIVSTGEAARRDIRASIAAIGWVRVGRCGGVHCMFSRYWSFIRGIIKYEGWVWEMYSKGGEPLL